MNAVFAIIDVILSPPHLMPRVAAILLCTGVPIFILVLFIIRFFHLKLGRWMHFVACLLALISGAGVLACASIGELNIPPSIFTTQYALVIIYFLVLYLVLFLSYIIVVAVQGGPLLNSFPWGILAAVVLGGITLVTSYKTEQIARTEWLLIFMGEKSKKKRERQKETVIGLLGNILPHKVIQKLKGGAASTFAEDFPKCTMMVVTLCDFGTLFEQLSPTDLVETLDTVFSGFDDVVSEYSALEKLKSVGVAYVVAGGVADQDSDHAQQMVECALKMVKMIQRISVKHGQQRIQLAIRVGIHTGPMHAGLVGWAKMIYDMWGEALVVAGLCSIHGMKDSVQITTATQSLLKTSNFKSDPSILSISSSDPLSTFILTNSE